MPSTTVPRRILIVDDEENAREGLAKLLRREGYSVVTAVDGLDGLDKLRRHEIDLIICDLKMPNMDGLTFVRRLQDLHYSGRVVVMTAYCGIDSYLEAMGHGVIEYINKPVRIDELRVVIRKVLS